ncbi:diguanylate cyclase (GGDEF)-like protein [Paenibacillus endophyticus]|uniref:Diguanylate cyclase (GGDEF)-like protein n=1 Tax=Paenibacillus endophyticus TaxID=1294268 RepID=A0A7W5C9K5_9BACL|nr:EAL domain-containing protein [Paenibacillus endophyticus]MBB3152674.1 diguanylate cyclase (GGDEF)-like protein [Paenibacillus endophyticus]
MSNIWFKQHHKQLMMVCAFSLCTFLALAAETNHFQFLYGITFSFTSLFILLILRLFGLLPGLLTSVVAVSTGLLFFNQPAYHSILIIEVLAAGFLIQKFKKSLFGADALFWLLAGIPLIYIFYSMDSPLNAKDLLLIACMIAMNGMFNSLFAEVIDHYLPLRRWSGQSLEGKKLLSFSKVLFHFSIGIVLISFLLNIFMNSLSSFKEVSLYAQRLSASEMNRIVESWNRWQTSKLSYSLTESEQIQEQVRFFQLLLGNHASTFMLHVTDNDHFIVAASDPKAEGQRYDWRDNRQVTAINSHLSLTMPNEPRQALQFHTWHDGIFVYTENIDSTDWHISIEVPIKNYQNYLFSKYFTHFIYLILLALFTAVLAFIINRSLSRGLTQLAAATTNLPLKLKQFNNIDWPSSSLVEVQSLIANFKHMSTNLIHMFQEAQRSNERLESQAFMLQQSEERLHQLAYYDMLTGLPNRLQFTLHFQDLIALHESNKQPIAVMFVDVNRFKQINDTLGHAVGDELLRQAAERFGTAVFRDCTVFRLGGDEFVFIGRYENEETVSAGAQAVVDSFNKPFIIDDKLLFLTVSVGVSLYPQDGEQMDTIIRNADIAMYSAKEQGDGCYRFYKPTLVSAMTEKMQVENGLYNALLQQQFSLHYQPKMSAATGKLCGIEALIRWHHPELGMVPPDKFIPLAEQSGFILDIDSWVFREACRQNKAWQDAGLQRICVSVNISARHFYQGNLTEMIIQALKDTGLEPQYVSLEITEGVFMQSMDQVIETILFLKNLGIQISIDDFGTGYSSLNQLQRLPISDVKLDRSFIQGITSDSKKSSIVKAIIELVHSMNMRVVAEGVETAEESQFCTDLQCDELQGYLFSRPLPPHELELLLGKAI